MKTQITVFQNLISRIDNDCSLRPSQKYTPQWHIHSRWQKFTLRKSFVNFLSKCQKLFREKGINLIIESVL